MIIWISGAYGVGKSSLADALADKIETASFSTPKRSEMQSAAAIRPAHTDIYLKIIPCGASSASGF